MDEKLTASRILNVILFLLPKLRNAPDFKNNIYPGSKR